MTGFSDVRLHLAAQELQAEGPCVRAAGEPAGYGLWALLSHRISSRRVLLTLTDAELRDVGLTWHQARAEGVKPFWRQ